MKIAVVGGASTYTPELVDGIGRLHDVLPVEELVLVDPAADRLELVADLQLRRFVRASEPGQVMDRGLWAWSRHPNYVGELGFWVAVALFVFPATSV